MIGGEIEALVTIANDPDRYGPWAGKNPDRRRGQQHDFRRGRDRTGDDATSSASVPRTSTSSPRRRTSSASTSAAARSTAPRPRSSRTWSETSSCPRSSAGSCGTFTGTAASSIKIPLGQVTQWEHTAFGPAGMVGDRALRPPSRSRSSGTATDDGLPAGQHAVGDLVGRRRARARSRSRDSHALSTTATFTRAGNVRPRPDRVRRRADDHRPAHGDRRRAHARTTPRLRWTPARIRRSPCPRSWCSRAAPTTTGSRSAGRSRSPGRQVSGPADVVFVNPTAGLSGALFDEAGHLCPRARPPATAS